MNALNQDNLRKGNELERCEEKFREVQPMIMNYER